jgi:hypothetical protein
MQLHLEFMSKWHANDIEELSSYSNELFKKDAAENKTSHSKVLPLAYSCTNTEPVHKALRIMQEL